MTHRNRNPYHLSQKCLAATEYLIEPTRSLVCRYLKSNSAAQWYLDHCPGAHIDHITPRTRKCLSEKAEPFISAGWVKKADYEYPTDGWIAEVYVHPDPQQPSLFVDSGKLLENGMPDPHHLISQWIGEFPEHGPTDYLLHHIAARVDDIYGAVREMEGFGFPFCRKADGSYAVLSGYDGKLQQIFSQPEILYGAQSKKMVVGTVFELIQRHPSLNNWDFIKVQASELMMKQSTGR